MRLDIIENGSCECLDYGDSVDSLVQGFIECGAFEANTPADQLTAFFAISNEGDDSTKSGQLRAIIHYLPVFGQDWPNMIVRRMDESNKSACYRHIDNGPDEIYGVERFGY